MTKTLQAAAQALYSACCNYGSQREQDIRDAARQYEAALSAPPPSEEEAVKDLETCNCRWRGEEQVQQCTLHEAHVHAIHEWAERAKTAEATLQVHRVGGQPAGDPAMPVVGEVRESNKFGLYFWRDMTHASQVGERLVRQSDALAAIAAARQERVPEQTRPAFEAWFADSRRSRGVAKRPDFAIREDGTYADDHTQRHWWTWQNAIAAPKPDAPAQATPAAGPAMQRMTPGIFKGELAMFPADDGDYVRRADALAAVAAVRLPGGWVALPAQATDAMAEAAVRAAGGWVEPYTAPRESGVLVESDISQADADRFNAETMAEFKTAYVQLLAAAPKPEGSAEATPDEVIDLACALEQRRALHIVAEVAALQIGGADSQTPTPFQAGYALACEEIETRLRTQQWVLGDVPAPLPPPAGSAA